MAPPSRKSVDSRGRTFDVPPPDWRLGLVKSEVRAKMLAQARAAIHGVPSGVGLRLVSGLLVGAVLGGIMAREVYQYMPLDGHLAAPTLGGIVGVGAAFGVFRLTDRAIPLSRVNPILSKCRLCIACGYDVATLPPAADGCMVCPECGVAIRLAPAEPSA